MAPAVDQPGMSAHEAAGINATVDIYQTIIFVFGRFVAFIILTNNVN
jgi:hypothetical protein